MYMYVRGINVVSFCDLFCAFYNVNRYDIIKRRDRYIEVVMFKTELRYLSKIIVFFLSKHVLNTDFSKSTLFRKDISPMPHVPRIFSTSDTVWLGIKDIMQN